MNKRLRLTIIFILAFFMLIPAKTLFAKDAETSLQKNDASGLDFDINSMAEYRAEKGLRNLEPYSIMLINRGLKAYNEKKEKETVMLLEGAKELSPDLPLTYFYLSWINFSFSPSGFSAASDYLYAGGEAFLNNFWWSFQTAGILSIGLFLAFYASMGMFLITLILSNIRLYIHDIIENKRKIFLLLIPIILVFLGPGFGIIGFMLLFWRYIKGKERVMVYMTVMTAILLVFASPWFSLFFDTLKDKTLHSVVKINEGLYTGEAIEIPREGRSYEIAFADALNLKRKGYYNKAAAVYKDILNWKEDAMVYNNLANSYVGLGNNDMAITFYDKALQLKKISQAYFNLSQIYRDKFDFTRAKEYYLKAIETDPRKVAFYNSIKGVSVNRFVMDETLSNKELWLMALKRPLHDKSIEMMLSFVNRELSAALFLLLMFALYISDRYSSPGAYKCIRCGEIYCRKCEKKIFHKNVCHICYKTLVKMDELTPKERVEKILEIQHYKIRRNQTMKILTLIFPGIGHIYYGWSVSGAVKLLLFNFFIFSTLLWFYIPTPVSMDLLSSFFRWASVTGLIVVYVTTVVNIFRRVP